jgi:FixJ family two-component response regulator
MRLAAFEVESFASVQALLASMAVEQAACLVLDADVPVVAGIGLERALIESGHDLPTILMTACAPERPSLQLAALHPVAVLHKPFGTEALLEALRRALG